MTVKSSKKIRAGLYEVTTDAGRVFHVDQIRTDAPGYGVEWLWWISPADDGPHPCIDPQYTKRDALAAINGLVEAIALNEAEVDDTLAWLDRNAE